MFHDRWGAAIDELPDAYVNRFLYLDIETTGLSIGRNRVITVGVYYFQDGCSCGEQWYADVLSEEPCLIAMAASRVVGFPAVVTYNGNRFDMPFLETRAARTGVLWPRVAHLDLLPRVLRDDVRLGLASDHRLQTVLRAVGVDRDHTSGAEVPSVYRRWLKSGDTNDRRWILQHNREDLTGLPTILTALTTGGRGNVRL